MSTPSPKWNSLDALRLSAEGRLRDGGTRPPQSSLEPEALARELELYQVELEMQNEALRDAYRDLESSRTHYRRLYELLPVPCISLTVGGLIIDANLAATGLLTALPEDLAGVPLSRYVLTEHAELFERYRREVSEKGRATGDIAFQAIHGGAFEARLEGVQTCPDTRDWLVTLVDVTEVNDLKRLLRESQRSEAFGVTGTGHRLPVVPPPLDRGAEDPLAELDAPVLLAALDITVLLVEGDTLARLATRGYLEEMRCEVLEVGTAEEALKRLKERQGEVRLALVDAVLPDLDGHELVRRLRELEPGIGAILTSTHPPSDVAEKDEPPSRGEILYKPFTGQFLLDAVRAALRTTTTVRPPGLTSP